MDFMKTLLLYMTLTFATSVQSTTAPVLTPAPTPEPTPTAIVETAIPTEVLTEITPAPVATERPSDTNASSPVLTPNKSYRTLNQKTAGAPVKKVQERLIELGYLKDGADGVYGTKTKNAVKEFQKYNGLPADGVAGKLTQTYLFEDPNVKAKPGAVTPTPAAAANEPAATPGPTAKPTPSPTPAITPSGTYRTLKLNARGNQVKKVQERLIELGYLKDNADGVYGGKTRNAVMAFQKKNGLKADGAAGKETQLWLFDHPDAKKADGTLVGPSVTEAPSVTDTPAPTEAPAVTEVPTPTEAPAETEAPATTEPSAEPEVTAEPEPTEALTEVPTEAPTEAPTQAPTEAPAEPTAVPEPEGPITTEAPEELIESVELEETEADQPLPLDGNVALNANGDPLSWIDVEDGTNVRKTPRLWMRNGEIWISLDDLVSAVDSWTMTDENGTMILEAEGYIIVFMEEDQGKFVLVDGNEIAMQADDVLFTVDGHPIKIDFLMTILNAETEWDDEENTLLIQTVDHDAANAAD